MCRWVVVKCKNSAILRNINFCVLSALVTECIAYIPGSVYIPGSIQQSPSITTSGCWRRWKWKSKLLGRRLGKGYRTFEPEWGASETSWNSQWRNYPSSRHVGSLSFPLCVCMYIRLWLCVHVSVCVCECVCVLSQTIRVLCLKLSIMHINVLMINDCGMCRWGGTSPTEWCTCYYLCMRYVTSLADPSPSHQ